MGIAEKNVLNIMVAQQIDHSSARMDTAESIYQNVLRSLIAHTKLVS